MEVSFDHVLVNNCSYFFKAHIYVLFYLKYKIDFPPMKHGFWNHNEDGCNQWHIRLSSLCCPKAWKKIFFSKMYDKKT